MTETFIQAVAGDLGTGYCPDSWQRLYLDIIARTVWKVPGVFKPYVVSATQPSVDDQDKVWFKTTSTGAPIRAFLYEPTYGWISPHPVPPTVAQFVTMWKGEVADLDTYDGGAVGAVGPITGPFWEVDSDFADKFPFGVGTLVPNSGDELAVFAGLLIVKANVRAASTATVTIATPGAAIDGVTLANGDRVLLKNQSTASENGIYTFNGAASAMTRTLDADTSGEVKKGMFTKAEAGTINANTSWVLVTDDPITLNTTALEFTGFDPLASGPKGKGVRFIRRTGRLYYTP